MERFIDWIGLQCVAVEDCAPPAADYALVLGDGRRVAVELTAASEDAAISGAVQGGLVAAVERKERKTAAYRASALEEVWLVVFTTATIEGAEGLARLERERVSSSTFDRVYLLDMVKGRALLRWPQHEG